VVCKPRLRLSYSPPYSFALTSESAARPATACAHGLDSRSPATLTRQRYSAHVSTCEIDGGTISKTAARLNIMWMCSTRLSSALRLRRPLRIIRSRTACRESRPNSQADVEPYSSISGRNALRKCEGRFPFVHSGMRRSTPRRSASGQLRGCRAAEFIAMRSASRRCARHRLQAQLARRYKHPSHVAPHFAAVLGIEGVEAGCATGAALERLPRWKDRDPYGCAIRSDSSPVKSGAFSTAGPSPTSGPNRPGGSRVGRTADWRASGASRCFGQS
jgi:hypothetical protein